VVDGVVVKVLLGDDLLDDLLLKLLAELLGGDIGRVLGGDDNGVDALGNNSAVVVLVLNGDLGLGVGPQPWERAVTAGSRHGSVELVGEEEGEGEQLGGLVGSITEHDTLVTGTELLEGLIVVKTLGDIGGLLLNGDEEVKGLVVETLLGVIVTDVLDGVTDDLLVVEPGLGGNLTEDHDHTGLGGSLASNLGEGVLLQAGIEDGIGDLIGNLIGVTLADRLGLFKGRLETGRQGEKTGTSGDILRLTVKRKLPSLKCLTPTVPLAVIVNDLWRSKGYRSSRRGIKDKRWIKLRKRWNYGTAVKRVSDQLYRHQENSNDSPYEGDWNLRTG
jgi:hypothetical protein